MVILSLNHLYLNNIVFMFFDNLQKIKIVFFYIKGFSKEV